MTLKGAMTTKTSSISAIAELLVLTAKHNRLTKLFGRATHVGIVMQKYLVLRRIVLVFV